MVLAYLTLLLLLLPAEGFAATPGVEALGMAVSPMKLFLLRSSRYFVWLRNAAIVLSIYYSVRIVWGTIVKGEKPLDRVLPLTLALMTLGATEWFVAFYLVREGEKVEADFEKMIEYALPDQKINSEPVKAGKPTPDAEKRQPDAGGGGKSAPPPAPKPVPAPSPEKNATDKPAEQPPPPAQPKRQQNRNSPFSSSGLGKLSERFEGGRDPGKINMVDRRANGDYICPPSDPGGCSFGNFQIATKTGTMANFLATIKSDYPEIYNRLMAAGGVAAAKAGKKSFVDAWKAIAKEAPDRFEAAQRSFIRKTIFEPAFTRIKRANPAFSSLLENRVVQEMIWSAAVQHGPGGAESIMNSTLKNKKPNVSVEQTIRDFYAKRSNFVGGLTSLGQSTKNGILDRYKREQQMATEMLKEAK